MTLGSRNDCGDCARVTSASGSDSGVLTGTCEAYPTGIPVDIFSGDVNHDELRGDEVNPVVFEAIRTSG